MSEVWRGRDPVQMKYLRNIMHKRLKEASVATLVYDLYAIAHEAVTPSRAREDMLRLLEKRLPDIFAPRHGGIPKGKSVGPYLLKKIGMKG